METCSQCGGRVQVKQLDWEIHERDDTYMQCVDCGAVGTVTENEDSQAEGSEENHGEVDGRPISSGWSITVGELRAAIKDVPDDYEVMLSNAEVDDVDISNVNIDVLYPPSLESPGLLVLGGGQILNSEYAFHERMDAHHLLGGTTRYYEGEWKTDR